MDRKSDWGKYNRFLPSSGLPWGMADFNVRLGIYSGSRSRHAVYTVCLLFKIKNIILFCNEFNIIKTRTLLFRYDIALNNQKDTTGMLLHGGNHCCQKLKKQLILSYLKIRWFRVKVSLTIDILFCRSSIHRLYLFVQIHFSCRRKFWLH